MTQYEGENETNNLLMNNSDMIEEVQDVKIAPPIQNDVGFGKIINLNDIKLNML